MDGLTGNVSMHGETLSEVLHEDCRISERPISAPMRMLTSGIYKNKASEVSLLAKLIKRWRSLARRF